MKEYPIKKGTPAKAAKNSVAPTESGKKKNAAMESSLFSYEGNKIDGAEGYGKKGKGGSVNKGVVATAANSVWPDNKCC